MPANCRWEWPSEIDGEPHRVADEAVVQLDAVLTDVAELMRQTVLQVENAGRQEALEAGERLAASPDAIGNPEASVGALDTWWRDNRPQQVARAELIRQLSERLPGVARALRYAVQRGE